MQQTAQQARGDAQASAQLAAQQALQSAQAAAQQAQSSADLARQAARDAQPAIAGQASPSVSTTVGPEGVTKVITVPDGNGGTARITIDRNGVHVGDVAQTSTQAPTSGDLTPRRAQFFENALIAVVVIAIGMPLVKVLGRLIERRTAPTHVPPEVMQRLAGIEQAVDAVAVEVERISEGQRFTTRLLSERTQPPAPEFVAAAMSPVEQRNG